MTSHRRPQKASRAFWPSWADLADALRVIFGCTGDRTWWFKTGGWADLDKDGTA
jgi:hypothetical protein